MNKLKEILEKIIDWEPENDLVKDTLLIFKWVVVGILWIIGIMISYVLVFWIGYICLNLLAYIFPFINEPILGRVWGY